MNIETPDTIFETEITYRSRTPYVLLISFFLGFVLLLVLLFIQFSSAPKDFPTDSSIVIESGMNVADIVEKFEKNNYVRSSSLLLLYLRFVYDTDDIQAGTYTFSDRISTKEVAKIIAVVGPSEPLILLTFPEGSTVEQFAEIADNALPAFDLTTFLSYAKNYEGHLFPETYFVPETFTDEELFDLLVKTSEEKIEVLQPLIDAHPLSLEEIIILASIIEREANTPESMKLVSGVLQNRLEIGMPLQADATMEYELGIPLGKLPAGQLAVELRETDSPYNTYKHVGLPPTPIGNPGLAAIEAVLEPTFSDYFYYITGTDGKFHFAETLQQHNLNIARHLR